MDKLQLLKKVKSLTLYTGTYGRRKCTCSCIGCTQESYGRKHKEYGWDVAVYSSIEHIYGYDYVTSCYKDNPRDSWKQLVDYMHEMYPEATDKQIRKILK